MNSEKAICKKCQTENERAEDKYEFRYSRKGIELTGYTNDMIYVSTNENSVDELCQYFSGFLKACGFNFNGEIGIIDNDRTIKKTV